jgi:Tfp pilus assembly PilM family ATPase
MKPRLIIEINERWLKIAAVRRIPAAIRRLKTVVKPLASAEPAQVGALLSQTLRQEKIPAGPVALCISRSQGTFLNLTLPSDDPKEIRQMVELNVARIVPDKREQVIYNYAVAGKNEQGFSRIMLAIMQHDLIVKQISAIESAGLQVENILLSSFGVFSMVSSRCSREIAASEVGLILDIDAGFADLLIFSGNVLLSSRSINIGNEQLGEEIGRRKLIGEIRQAIVVFHSQEAGKKPSKMFISGARVNIESVAAMAREELGIEVKPVVFGDDDSSTGSVSLTAPVEFLGNRNANTGVNFIVPEIEVRRTLRDKSREIMQAGALIFYLCFVSVGIFWGRQNLMQGYESYLERRIGAISAGLGDTGKQYEQLEAVNEQLAARKLPLAFIAYLVNTLPPEIAVKYVRVGQDKKVVLKGEAQELSDIFKFVSLLEKKEFCRDVKTQSTRKRKVRDRELTDFELNLTLAF